MIMCFLILAPVLVVVPLIWLVNIATSAVLDAAAAFSRWLKGELRVFEGE